MSSLPIAPQNLEAEESVLGAMMLAPAAIDAVRKVVGAPDFYRESHARIFEAALALHERGEPVDAITLVAELEKRGELENAGGRERVHEIACIVPASTNAPHYARIVLDAARRRREDVLGLRIREASQNGGVPAHPDIRAELQALLDDCDRDGALEYTARAVDGLGFVTAVEALPTEANWGGGNAVLWMPGEPLMIVGPDGVGKTSLGQRLILARLDGGELLGLPVARAAGKVLYIAADRPRQAARSMRRMVGDVDEQLLRERLVVHRGPLPFDVVTAPAWTLRQFAEELGASDIVVDALKDLASELTKDEVGSAVNRAFQEACAAGLELVVLHHQRKQQQGAPAPRKLADVYGSRWLVAGMGSVVMVWGEPGDLVVSFKHLKQPVEEVGPFDVMHDHVRGTTAVLDRVELEQLLARAAGGLTVRDAARIVFGRDDPERNELEKARRRLESLIARNQAERRDDADGLAHYYAKETA